MPLGIESVPDRLVGILTSLARTTPVRARQPLNDSPIGALRNPVDTQAIGLGRDPDDSPSRVLERDEENRTARRIQRFNGLGNLFDQLV